MNPKITDRLKRVFHEAQVIDFDFSEWDRHIRLVVVAWNGITNNEPIYNIDFIGVRSVFLESNHLKVKLDSKVKHCQWHIVGVTVKPEQKGCSILLRGIGPAPTLKIRSHNIRVTRLKRNIVERVCPKWGAPYSPLARPSLQKMGKRKV